MFISSKDPQGQFQANLAQIYPLVEEIQICSNEGIYGLPKREICVKAKYSVTMFKETLLNHSFNLNQTWCKAFSDEIW